MHTLIDDQIVSTSEGNLHSGFIMIAAVGGVLGPVCLLLPGAGGWIGVAVLCTGLTFLAVSILGLLSWLFVSKKSMDDNKRLVIDFRARTMTFTNICKHKFLSIRPEKSELVLGFDELAAAYPIDEKSNGNNGCYMRIITTGGVILNLPAGMTNKSLVQAAISEICPNQSKTMPLRYDSAKKFLICITIGWIFALSIPLTFPIIEKIIQMFR